MESFVVNNEFKSRNIPVGIIITNPLFHEFHFTSVFQIIPKIGSCRLPTHRRGAHRIFFR